ncbi:MAG TPA: nucleotidyltransferase domain-containing protein [Planctomycetota bacterium]|nr:nucleotidyltransferase domain-containing protein [Planctomycetota bacterium]
MLDPVRRVLESDSRIAYALVFGSSARGTAHARSDLDLAIGLGPGKPFEVREIGTLVSALESAAGIPVDLVLLDEVGPALAYRVFRDGHVLLERDRAALVERKARSILEYLDFRPVEELCTRGVLAAAMRGR